MRKWQVCTCMCAHVALMSISIPAGFSGVFCRLTHLSFTIGCTLQLSISLPVYDLVHTMLTMLFVNSHILTRKLPLALSRKYSTTPRNRNQISRNHLEISLSASQKHRNSLGFCRPCQCVYIYIDSYKTSAESRAGEREL